MSAALLILIQYREPDLTDKDKQHWAFRPPVRPAVHSLLLQGFRSTIGSP